MRKPTLTAIPEIDPDTLIAVAAEEGALDAISVLSEKSCIRS